MYRLLGYLQWLGLLVVCLVIYAIAWPVALVQLCLGKGWKRPELGSWLHFG